MVIVIYANVILANLLAKRKSAVTKEDINHFRLSVEMDLQETCFKRAFFKDSHDELMAAVIANPGLFTYKEGSFYRGSGDIVTADFNCQYPVAVAEVIRNATPIA